MEHDVNKDRNLKLLLLALAQTSDLKINIHKSELLCFTKAKEAEAQYTNLFGCPQGQLPFKYLIILMHYQLLTCVECKFVEECLEKCLNR